MRIMCLISRLDHFLRSLACPCMGSSMMKRFYLVLMLLVISSVTASPPVGHWFSRIFIIVMENSDPAELLNNTFFSELVHNGTLLTNVSASGRPSQPNYIALLAGSMLGVTSNDNVDISGTSIVDKFEAAGVTWKAYMEDYPGNCYAGANTAKYYRKHNPFISFNNIR